jgi:hypothetical protein
MSVAWKIQRILTASTSAALLLMVFRKRGSYSDGDEPLQHEATVLDEVIGLMVAGLGLYTQIGHGFSFQIPLPWNLVTWPFSLAENWIQWQIIRDTRVNTAAAGGT